MAMSIRDYLVRGPSTSKEIQAATGLSQSTVVRYLKKLGNRVVHLQKGRSVRYAATCNAFGSDDKLPLSVVDTQGHLDVVAHIRPLVHGGFFIEPVNDVSRLLLGAGQDGLYDGLPYFLYDLRPQGFIGRQIARRLASQSDDFPSNPKRWTTNHIGRYLIANGEDLSGNLLFGEQARLRVYRNPVAISEKDYPALADRVMRGDVPGSSAGGEQPKFTAYNGDLSSHVIVKFSPKGDNDLSQRWRDILITEHHAAERLNHDIFPATTSRLFEIEGRLFLETKRIDRHQVSGRSSMIALEAIDAEYAGLGNTWPQVMKALLAQKLVRLKDVRSTEAVWLFGRFINNTDMHMGNLSLSMGKGQFKLLPVYDMCSMGFAPKSGGEVPSFEFDSAGFSFDQFNQRRPLISDIVFENVKSAAHDFWEQVANDDRISDKFKRFLDRGNPVGMLPTA